MLIHPQFQSNTALDLIFLVKTVASWEVSNIESDDKDKPLLDMSHFNMKEAGVIETDPEEALQCELCLSAMMLCTAVEETGPVDYSHGEVNLGVNLKDVTETEGLIYFAGCIARKFPQYQLGSKCQNTLTD